MRFNCYVLACVAAAMVGVAVSDLFWWSMAGAGALWACGIVVETIWLYNDGHPRGRGESARDSGATPAA